MHAGTTSDKVAKASMLVAQTTSDNGANTSNDEVAAFSERAALSRYSKMTSAYRKPPNRRCHRQTASPGHARTPQMQVLSVWTPTCKNFLSQSPSKKTPKKKGAREKIPCHRTSPFVRTILTAWKAARLTVLTLAGNGVRPGNTHEPASRPPRLRRETATVANAC